MAGSENHPQWGYSPFFWPIWADQWAKGMCWLFLFGILGTMATRYAGTTIAQIGQADHDCEHLPVDTRAEFIGRQLDRTKWVQPACSPSRSKRLAGGDRTPIGARMCANHQQARAGHDLERMPYMGYSQWFATLIGSELFFPATIKEFVSGRGFYRNSGMASSY